MGRNHLIGNCREKVQCLLCSRFGHNTLMHAAPPTSQTSSSSPSSSSGVVNVAPAGSSLGVQNRLLQLSGTQPVDPTPIGGNPQENQVNISAIISNVDCFRPIYAMQVSLPNGASTAVYGLYDTGSNKTLISRKFQREFGVPTRQQFVTLNGLGSSSSGQRDVATLTLKSLVDPQMVIADVEAYVVESLPVKPDHIA